MKHTRALQKVWGHDGIQIVSIEMPCPQTEILPGIHWGSAEHLFTPAFWKYQAHMQRKHKKYATYNIGCSLMEEVAVCMLGGYGMPAELGLAAFNKLREHQLLDGKASEQVLEKHLSTFFIVSGKQRRYRFPRQKAKYLALTLKRLRKAEVPTDAIKLRDFLAKLDGIGPKTASWIVRNHLGTDEVAILDVHIIRAGILMGLYSCKDNPTQSYYSMERLFLDFCSALGEQACLVDAIMWDIMRRIGQNFALVMGLSPKNRHAQRDIVLMGRPKCL
ncbi:MAG: hypothetical protein OXU27_04915 [Candidatus Poribacteria bacterium]|nr:hypothetical protein [Candidatus Poribacteria bacterium]